MSKIKHTKNVNPDGSIEILSVKKDLNLYFSEIANCPICSGFQKVLIGFIILVAWLEFLITKKCFLM